jgi:hypothetical protein
MPWFQLVLRPEVVYNPELDPAEIVGMNELLMLAEMQVQATLETSGIRPRNNSQPSGFLSNKVKSLRQLVVTGDTLERLDDDFRLRVYRRDNYTTKRDSNGDVYSHITREQVDPLSLSDEQFSKSGLSLSDMEKVPAKDRMKSLYTSVDYHPQSRRWVIEQYVEAALINEMEETVSPYFGTPFRLAPNEDYGRGLVELNLANLRGLNTLEARRLDVLAIIAKIVPCIDHGSPTNEADLTLRSGVPIRTKVRDGQVQDVALLGGINPGDVQILNQGVEIKSRELAQAFLVESASSRDAERVTAFERRRNAMELNGAMGGVYPSIADAQHLPMLRRTIHVLQKKNLLPKIDDELYDIHSLTGLTAIVRDQKAESLLELAQVVQALGPDAMARIDTGVLLQTYMQYRQLYSPGLRLTDEQLAAKQREAMNNQAMMEANTQAIKSAGAITEQTVAAGA